MNLKYLYPTLFISLFLCQPVYSQLDSLKNELRTATGEKRIDVINKLSYTFSFSNLDSSKFYAWKGHDEAVELGYTYGQLMAMINIGYSHLDLNKQDSAIYVLKQGIELAQKTENYEVEMDMYLAIGNVYSDLSNHDSTKWAFEKNVSLGEEIGREDKTTAARNNLGRLFKDLGNFDLAIKYFLKAADMNRSQGNVTKTVNNYSSIGFIYLENKDGQKANDYFQKAYELIKDTDYIYQKWQVMTGLGLSFNELEQFDKAKLIFDEVLEDAKKHKDDYQIASTTHNLADLYNDLGQHEKAKKACLEAIAIFQKLKLDYGLAYGYTLLCVIELDLENYQLAVDNAQKGIELANKLEFKKLENDSRDILSKALAKLGRHKEAFDERLIYEEAQQEIFNEEKSKQIATLTTEFETKEKEIQIARQEEQLTARDEQIRQQQLVQVLMAVAILLFIGLVVFIYVNFKRQKQTSQVLKEQKDIIEKTSQERATLLKEIHHRVKNNLQVISSLLNIQSRNTKNEQARSAIKEGQSRIKSMALIHQKLYNTDNLSKIDMQEYIDQLSNYLFKSFGPGDHVKNQIEIDKTFMDVNTAIPLGLIINELISNAYKYAFEGKAEGKLLVKLAALDDGKFELEVKDDGKGMDEEINFEETESIGLSLVNTLTQQLNGKLDLESSNGTSFKITFYDKLVA